MSRFDAVINVPYIPPPKLIEELAIPEIVARLVAEYKEQWPGFDDETEFEPSNAHLHVDAYVDLLVRQRLNEAASAAMLASAVGGDLDLHGWARNTIRKLLVEGDASAVPAVDPLYESDQEYRKRIQLAPESWSVAGPEGAYVYWALTEGQIKDATAVSPSPAEVIVTALSYEGDGACDTETLERVTEAVSAENRRPLADRVEVRSAEIVSYSLSPHLYILPGPDAHVVLARVHADIEAFVKDRHRIGRSIALSQLHEALTVEGVERVLNVTEISVEAHQAPYCTGITITHEVADV